MEGQMSIAGRMARATGTWIPAALARPFGAPAAVYFHGVERRLIDPAIQINQHALDAQARFRRLASDGIGAGTQTPRQI
jgi:hypothetical protein